jgi:hypothetical protein
MFSRGTHTFGVRRFIAAFRQTCSKYPSMPIVTESGDQSPHSKVSRILLFCLLTTALLTGCRRSDDLEVSKVTGTVTYQGKPIPDGEVRFVPTGQTKGPASAGTIRDGKYEVVARGGVPVGTHRVEVRAFRVKVDPRAAQDLPGMAAGGPKEQYLPAKFNDASNRTITVESGQKTATKDFDLKD